MQEIDHAIKIAMTLNPDCTLDLLFGSERQTKLKEVADAQINIPELRADKMLLVEEGEKQYYILCEAMLQPDASALPIFALKALGHQYLLNKPTLVVIVYLSKGDYATFPDSFENSVHGLSNEYKLQRVLLWEHLHRILNGELREFLPFLSLLYERPDPSLMDEQINLLSQIADPKLRADLIATTIIVNIRTFGREIVLIKFVKETNMLKDTTLVQGWMTESRQEGWQEGQKQGQLVVLKSILSQKFGALSPSVLLKLQGLSNEQLDRLTLMLLNIASQDELQAWLANGVDEGAKN